MIVAGTCQEDYLNAARAAAEAGAYELAYTFLQDARFYNYCPMCAEPCSPETAVSYLSNNRAVKVCAKHMTPRIHLQGLISRDVQ